MQIDFEEEAPAQVTDTHWAKTWLLIQMHRQFINQKVIETFTKRLAQKWALLHYKNREEGNDWKLVEIKRFRNFLRWRNTKICCCKRTPTSSLIRRNFLSCWTEVGRQQLDVPSSVWMIQGAGEIIYDGQDQRKNSHSEKSGLIRKFQMTRPSSRSLNERATIWLYYLWRFDQPPFVCSERRTSGKKWKYYAWSWTSCRTLKHVEFSGGQRQQSVLPIVMEPEFVIGWAI